MARFSLSLLRKLQAPIRKIWDAFAKLQADEDERWKEGIKRQPASQANGVEASECGKATETPPLFTRPEERPVGATPASGPGPIASDSGSAAGPVPSLSELVARRQKENKLAAVKGLSKEAPDE